MGGNDEDKRPSERVTRHDAGANRKAPPPPGPPRDRYVDTTLAGRYRILKKLGQGGMGAVYLAEHVHIEKKVAIKILSNQHSRELLTRFAQEARSASKIGHENIIDITDFGETDEGVAFLAMEHLEGSDLGHLLRTGGALPLPRAANIMYQVCRALAAAHEKGIVHRDLKPDNVFLVEREGRSDFAKVLDFGLARVTTVEPGSRLTKSGAILGTPEYMAPEQVRGDPVDGRADVYAAGCMLYELLTGDIPFSGGNYMIVLQKHLQLPPEPPSKLMPGIAAELDAVVMTAMAKEPARRFQSMKDLALALCAAAGDEPRQVWGADAAQARETPTVQAPELAVTRAGRRASKAIWLGGVVVIAAIVGAMVWWSRPHAVDRLPSPAPPAIATPVVAAQPPVLAAQPPPVEATPPTPAVVADSRISIGSEPAGAEVRRDGALVGRTPLVLKLPPGTPPFELTLARHGWKDVSFQVAPDHDREYVLTLVAAHKPRAVESKEPAARPGSPELKDVFSE